MFLAIDRYSELFENVKGENYPLGSKQPTEAIIWKPQSFYSLTSI